MVIASRRWEIGWSKIQIFRSVTPFWENNDRFQPMILTKLWNVMGFKPPLTVYFNLQLAGFLQLPIDSFDQF